MRLGVRLAPLRLMLFDMIAQSGQCGVDSGELRRRLADKALRKSVSSASLWNLVAFINSEIALSGYVIVSTHAGQRKRSYRLERTRTCVF